MIDDTFDISLNDSQSSSFEPIPPEKFDLSAYEDYSLLVDERARAFWNAKQGLAVYRRFRSGRVFAEASRDIELSLSLQLGGLKASMDYPTDIPNFLEPWYGIGVIASAFGVNYIWNPGQAPAIQPPFTDLQEALEYSAQPVEETPIGKKVLLMTEYFLEKTQGRIPISLTDVQSPMNIASYLIETNAFYVAMYDEPESLKILLDRITKLSTDFYGKLINMTGDALVWPGHGFASSRAFHGFGFSDDGMVMLSPEMYLEFEVPYLTQLTQNFGGAAFHSCGNWGDKIPVVQQIGNLQFVDAAFSKQTDPDPNSPATFGKLFKDTGVIINARIVGGMESVHGAVEHFYTNSDALKLIVVTYCQDRTEQAKVYETLHAKYD